MDLQKILNVRNEKLFDIFRGNLANISDLLNKCTPIEYTFHDKEKHCETLELYCFQLLPERLKQKMSNDEFFILLNGIYYHDIGMSSYILDNLGNLSVNRNCHNIIARDKIYDFTTNQYNTGIIHVPNKTYAKSIALLCYAHRDHFVENGEGGKRKVLTLDEINPAIEKYQKDCHTQILACVLRLADELDISFSRAPEDIFIEIKDFLPEKSKVEWMTHAFFKSVRINSSSFRITLIPNIEEIAACEYAGMERTLIRKMIFSKLDKVQEELNFIHYYFKKSDDVDYDLGYRIIDIEYDKKCVTELDRKVFDSERETAIEQLQLINSANIDLERPKHKKHIKTRSQKKNDIVLNSRIIQKINSFREIFINLKKIGVVKVGAFILPSGYYTRFQIKTNHILTKSEILNEITEIFYELFIEQEIDYVIGIDKAGIILSPNLALKLKTHCTYIIINSSDRLISNQMELEFHIEEKKSILLITDTIASGKTIEIAILQIKQLYNPKQIFVSSVFITNNKFYSALKAKFLDIQFFFLIDTLQFDLYTEKEIKQSDSLKSEFGL